MKMLSAPSWNHHQPQTKPNQIWFPLQSTLYCCCCSFLSLINHHHFPPPLLLLIRRNYTTLQTLTDSRSKAALSSRPRQQQQQHWYIDIPMCLQTFYLSLFGCLLPSYCHGEGSKWWWWWSNHSQSVGRERKLCVMTESRRWRWWWCFSWSHLIRIFWWWCWCWYCSFTFLWEAGLCPSDLLSDGAGAGAGNDDFRASLINFCFVFFLNCCYCCCCFRWWPLVLCAFC